MLRPIVNEGTCRLLCCSAPNPLSFLSRIVDKDAKSLNVNSSGSMSGQKHPIEFFHEETSQRKYTRTIESRSESSRQAIETFVTNKKDRAGKPLRFEYCIISLLDWMLLQLSSKIQWWQCLSRTALSLHATCVRIRGALNPRHVKGNLMDIGVKDHRLSCQQNGAEGALHFGRL